MKFQTNLITAPAELVASVVEAKEYLRIDNSLEDTRIEMMISAATSMLENYLSLKFVEQVWDVFTDYFPMNGRTEWWDGVRDYSIKELSGQAKNITFPLGIAKEFMQFATYDSDNNEFLESVSAYNFDNINRQTRVGLKIGGVWPQTVLRANNGIRFRFKLGYGNAAAVPKEIKMAILELVAHMYENRGDQNEMKIPPHIMTLVGHLKRMKLEDC